MLLRRIQASKTRYTELLIPHDWLSSLPLCTQRQEANIVTAKTVRVRLQFCDIVASSGSTCLLLCWDSWERGWCLQCSGGRFVACVIRHSSRQVWDMRCVFVLRWVKGWQQGISRLEGLSERWGERRCDALGCAHSKAGRQPTECVRLPTVVYVMRNHGTRAWLHGTNCCVPLAGHRLFPEHR
jgi:hypothetical protein